MIFLDEAVIATDMEVLFINKSLILTIFILFDSQANDKPFLCLVSLTSWIQIQILEYCGSNLDSTEICFQLMKMK